MTATVALYARPEIVRGEQCAEAQPHGQAGGIILAADFNGLLGRLVMAGCGRAGQVVTSAAP